MRFLAVHAILEKSGLVGESDARAARLQHPDGQQGKAFWTFSYGPGTQAMTTEKALVALRAFEEKYVAVNGALAKNLLLHNSPPLQLLIGQNSRDIKEELSAGDLNG
jgi:hypothetical protein